MIVVDPSAIVAVLMGEPEAPRVKAALEAAHTRMISAASVVELGIVVESRTGGRTPVERVLQRFELSIEPLDQAQSMTAMEAWRRFGKGNHPAQLNLGDCYSYALAAVRGVPLLFVGSDFTQTDIIAA
ncbi:type II toxin-antitoxin system VapC family toxin [Tessaracoccus massiliensis]|uniref:type II toxin-antitoxin system VapC family toxin n=1 Tax=Tessaracoccus massiliensis TaxID=1522311 RepID=UPI0006944C45|nr:type II toxin-antitoxin system VapC family toxin [Tessaracoccus massiliensis]